MSRILDFRQRIVDAIKTSVPELKSVDWFDGQFDQDDVRSWSVRTPCAFVGVMRAPTEHLPTMELNVELRVVVVIITQDKAKPRESDSLLWEILEKVVVLANLNAFDDPNASPATGLRFERLRDPELRREGVALGVIEWQSGLTIGRNRIYERDFIYHPQTGEMITQLPEGLTAETEWHNAAGEESEPETVDLSVGDEAYPGDEDPA